jgi:hypothetical protein
MTFAVVVPWSGGFPTWWVLIVLVVPILMLMFQDGRRPSMRRLLAAFVFCVACAVALYAEEIVVMPPCETCKLVEPGSWLEWYCKWVLWC